ncbi:MAG: hemerythrin domain-containing protein [Paracoccaceae bacterium]|nr:hemerythrin domain-containing protein [Paracoccaceae bacterium]
MARGGCVPPKSAPSAAELRRLGDPLDLIARDHMRARCIHAALRRIAEAQSRPEDDPCAIARFLRDELPPHLEDEEAGLFPVLRLRCLPEEAIGPTLDALMSDHTRERLEMTRVGALMVRLAEGGAPLEPPEVADALSFARTSLRHLIVENAIVLPLARARLNRRDRDRLLRAMVQRRGLDALMPPSVAHPVGVVQ